MLRVVHPAMEDIRIFLAMSIVAFFYFFKLETLQGRLL